MAGEGLQTPVGAVELPDGTLMVSNIEGGMSVSRIDTLGRRSIVADGLSSPVGLVRAPDGHLMVSTWGANATFRIRRA